MKPILEIQHISKKYSIGKGKEPYLSLRDSLAGIFNKSQANSDFWALNDVSFEVYPGDSVGIVGKNGAGKSTLLKILSKITPPTSGQIITRGRIASLLEVGTGFHPELTGRENIYLNGSILGLRKREIDLHFDAIIDFSGVEKFIDTPLKRYSSGMQLRLAFAVAAHLEPEILIIDEVLAVGDAEFQKKCLGKMDEVSKSGRTVLFVSHDLAAVQSLTEKSIWLDNGCLLAHENTVKIIESYSAAMKKNYVSDNEINTKGEFSKIRKIEMVDTHNNQIQIYKIGENFNFKIEFEIFQENSLSLELFLLDHHNKRIGLISTYQFHESKLPSKGLYSVNLEIQPINLASGSYIIEAATSVINSHWDHYVDHAVYFEVLHSNPLNYSWNFKQEYSYGNIALILNSKPVFEKLN